MKTKLALSLLVVALLPACATTKTTSTSSDGKRYANNSMEAAPPAEGPEADIPAEGPHDVNVNPAYVPTPLLRNSAMSGL